MICIELLQYQNTEKLDGHLSSGTLNCFPATVVSEVWTDCLHTNNDIIKNYDFYREFQRPYDNHKRCMAIALGFSIESTLFFCTSVQGFYCGLDTNSS